jgi:hypothetical protein
MLDANTAETEGESFQEVLYLAKDFGNGARLGKHLSDIFLVAIDLFVSMYVRLAGGIAPSVTGDLVEPHLQKFGFLEDEGLYLISKTDDHPVSYRDQLATAFESNTRGKGVTSFKGK